MLHRASNIVQCRRNRGLRWLRYSPWASAMWSNRAALNSRVQNYLHIAYRYQLGSSLRIFHEGYCRISLGEFVWLRQLCATGLGDIRSEKPVTGIDAAVIHTSPAKVGYAAFAEIGLTELPASYPTLMTVTVTSRSLLISDAAQGISRRALQSQLGYSPAANCALRLDRLPNLVVAPSL